MIKMRRKMTKMQKNIEEMDSLAETDWHLVEQQGKTANKSSQYGHYYCFKRPRR